jgi:transcriptional regulator with XRE-family HTH domain
VHAGNISAVPRELRQHLAVGIRALRADRGWSQEVLAERAGLHRTYISSVERGQRNVSIDNIERIGLALGLGPSEILGEKRRGAAR